MSLLFKITGLHWHVFVSGLLEISMLTNHTVRCILLIEGMTIFFPRLYFFITLSFLDPKALALLEIIECNGHGF